MKLSFESIHSTLVDTFKNEVFNRETYDEFKRGIGIDLTSSEPDSSVVKEFYDHLSWEFDNIFKQIGVDQLEDITPLFEDFNRIDKFILSQAFSGVVDSSVDYSSLWKSKLVKELDHEQLVEIAKYGVISAETLKYFSKELIDKEVILTILENRDSWTSERKGLNKYYREVQVQIINDLEIKNYSYSHLGLYDTGRESIGEYSSSDVYPLLEEELKYDRDIFLLYLANHFNWEGIKDLDLLKSVVDKNHNVFFEDPTFYYELIYFYPHVNTYELLEAFSTKDLFSDYQFLSNLLQINSESEGSEYTPVPDYVKLFQFDWRNDIEKLTKVISSWPLVYFFLPDHVQDANETIKILSLHKDHLLKYSDFRQDSVMWEIRDSNFFKRKFKSLSVDSNDLNRFIDTLH